jgi:membrane protein implicated in regulation of membrane protease activity
MHTPQVYVFSIFIVKHKFTLLFPLSSISFLSLSLFLLSLFLFFLKNRKKRREEISGEERGRGKEEEKRG